MMLILVNKLELTAAGPTNSNHQESLLLLLMLLLKCCDFGCIAILAKCSCLRLLTRADPPSWGKALPLAGM